MGVTNSYNSLGQLTGSTVTRGGSAQSRTLSYALDAGGRRTRLTWPDGSAVTYAYDGASRMTGIYQGTDTTAPLWTYVYSDNGHRVRRTATGGQYVEAQADGLGRMTSLATNLSGATHDNSTTFAFNPASQILSRTISNDAYAWTAHVNVDRPYAVNGLNQYTTAGSAAFTYDANGNLTSDGSSTYLYDVENRLVSASGATTVVLVHDPLGRLWQTSGGAAGAVRFVYDGDELVAEYSSAGTLLRRYVHGSGVDDPVVWYEGAGLTDRRWLTADHQGSIVGISQAAATVGVNRYDEYGIPAAANIGRFQYTGQAWIPELRMYHYKARIYSPTLGRFLQTDPIGYDDQVNLYAYVGNDPVNRTDPTGRHTCEGSEADCRKVASYYNQLRSAARNASTTGTRIRPAYQAHLKRVANFLGRPGENNGVRISATDLPRGRLGDASIGRDGAVEISLDVAAIERSRSSTGAGVLGHEGTHGIQIRDSGPLYPGSRLLQEVYRREIQANGTEQVINAALNQRTALWNPGMSAAERRNRVDRAAGMSCEAVADFYASQLGGQTCP